MTKKANPSPQDESLIVLNVTKNNREGIGLEISTTTWQKQLQQSQNQVKTKINSKKRYNFQKFEWREKKEYTKGVA